MNRSLRVLTMEANRCPGCDRYVGPEPECPYCGCDTVQNPAFRYLRLVACALATWGLAGLLIASRHREPPLMTVAEIRPTMNFAAIRLVGRAKKTYVAREQGRVRYGAFWLHDESGRIRVTAYDNVANALVEQQRWPANGAACRAQGTLSIQYGRPPKLILRSAEDLVLDDER